MNTSSNRLRPNALSAAGQNCLSTPGSSFSDFRIPQENTLRHSGAKLQI